MQERGIDDAEDRRRRTNAQSDRQDGDGREAGRLAEHAEGEAHILEQRVDPLTAERLAAFLREPLGASELDAGAALGLDAIQAGTFEVVGAIPDVRANLFREVNVGLRTMKEPGRQGTKIGQGLHVSCGCAARAEAMAAARRFQPSISSRRRLRPEVVSS